MTLGLMGTGQESNGDRQNLRFYLSPHRFFILVDTYYHPERSRTRHYSPLPPGEGLGVRVMLISKQVLKSVPRLPRPGCQTVGADDHLLSSPPPRRLLAGL